MLHHRALHFLNGLAVSCLATGAVRGDESLPQLQARFDRETDSVRKAKLIARLGKAEFDQARAEIDAGNDESAVKQFENYRENARAALSALEKEHPDAERRPDGYRQLEEHVREAGRFVRDADAGISVDFRPRLAQVRQDLERLDEELLDRLFPRRPGRKSAAKPAPEHPRFIPQR